MSKENLLPHQETERYKSSRFYRFLQEHPRLAGLCGIGLALSALGAEKALAETPKPNLTIENADFCYESVAPQFPGWEDNIYHVNLDVANQGDAPADPSKTLIEVHQGMQTAVGSETLSTEGLNPGETANFNTQIHVSRPPSDSETALSPDYKGATIAVDANKQVVESNELDNLAMFSSIKMCPPEKFKSFLPAVPVTRGIIGQTIPRR